MMKNTFYYIIIVAMLCSCYATKNSFAKEYIRDNEVITLDKDKFLYFIIFDGIHNKSTGVWRYLNRKNKIIITAYDVDKKATYNDTLIIKNNKLYWISRDQTFIRNNKKYYNIFK